jgi:Ca2+:H+ antiporter
LIVSISIKYNLKLLHLIPYLLLIFVPIAPVARYYHWDDRLTFISSALAIVALAIWLSTATEKVAVVTGPSIGGLVNAFFGNATGLIIALVALKKGLIDIVKASIAGSILCDLLLFMGLAMLAGGICYKEQRFKPILARVNGSSMTLAAVAIALPTMVIYTSNVVDPTAIRNLSFVVAAVLILVYGLTLLFSLKTHSYLYDVGLAIEDKITLEKDSLDRPHNDRLKLWILILFAATITVGFESELFVSVVESSIDDLGLTPLFTGVILLPLISDVPGIITVVRLAIKNQMNLTVATALGDSLLVSLFVAPVLVFVGQIGTQKMDLNFNPFEVVALIIAVTVTNLISFSGRCNWLDGILLLATYIVLGVAFYYHPA